MAWLIKYYNKVCWHGLWLIVLYSLWAMHVSSTLIESSSLPSTSSTVLGANGDMIIAVICPHRHSLNNGGHGSSAAISSTSSLPSSSSASSISSVNSIIDMKCDSIAKKLQEFSSTHINIHYYILAPKPHNSMHDYHKLPYHSKLRMIENSNKDIEVFFEKAKSAIAALTPRPQVIWSLELMATDKFQSLQLPMICHLPTVYHRASSTIVSHKNAVWLRFQSDDSLRHWTSLLNSHKDIDPTSHAAVELLNVNSTVLMAKPVVLLNSFVVPESAHDVNDLVWISRLLINNSSSPAPSTLDSDWLKHQRMMAASQLHIELPRIPQGINDQALSTRHGVLTASSNHTTLTDNQKPASASNTPPTIKVDRNLLIKPTVLQAKGASAQPFADLKRPPVVGSMTTMLPRLMQIDGPFGKTIDSILNIPLIDMLILNIPWAYGVRNKSDNITIPQKLLDRIESTVGNRLRVLRSPDFGPATKLLPTLLLDDSELPPETMIITFDDDRLYTPEAVAALVNVATQQPQSVSCIAAWPITILSSHGKRGIPGGPNFVSHIHKQQEGVQYRKSGLVDLSLGFYGVLYRKKFFASPLALELFDYDLLPEFRTHCMWVDDIWFSGHLERLHIPRVVIGNVPSTRADITSLSNVGALSLDQGESVKQNRDNVYCAEAMRKAFGIWK